MTQARSAVVQDWFFEPGGSELVALELAGLLPSADVLTSFMDPAYQSCLVGHRIRTWPLDRIAAARHRYRAFLPLYPLWFEALGTKSYELVISSSSAFAKAVRTKPAATHVAYIHAPMRFAWDLEGYLARSSVSPLGRVGSRVLRPMLRRWDRRTSRGPTVLLANSAAVRDRIRRYWGRDAEIIHPPVRLDDISVSSRDDGFLLVVARLLAYRRIDLLVSAARQLGRRLVVVGDGPELKRLRALAGPETQFLGHVPRPTLVDLLASCHAYVVPGEEDFGIAPVEAMAAGKPVVAFRRGGALETVDEGTTGVFFDEPTVGALADAIGEIERVDFETTAIRTNAERFAAPVFRRKIVQVLGQLDVDPALYRTDAAMG